ncbi:DUF4835 family protein [Panacibacter ginsenosidivorans]|uniref:DUF4835 family protein n=1 Tax=Panacibacter ginsenosidivorans TaxID=1813871 RepID=A0A5B8V9G1_9BACT|nr:DUF4835 family protein [Panacibacter ginsenosidivorans]QEC67356.1 DUF4835 family protein [Panacibacter ginsenosidivorans]
MPKKICLLVLLTAVTFYAGAQEMQAKVTVLAQQLGTSVNKNIFVTMQNQLTNMINSRKWTKDVFQTQEKIQCNFLLNISSVADDNVYKASLTIQAARPVYNATYQSPLVNFQDVDFTFKYIEYQPVEFNETRVGGNDPLAGNLTAIFAYYVYIILGLDYDSFEAKGGDPYFQKAQNIVTNAPESRDISGWKAFDGNRNRYWLSNNLTTSKYNQIHDILYSYFRSGLDNLYQDQVAARNSTLSTLGNLMDFVQQNPNTMIVQFFLQNRSDELIGIFKKADPLTKAKAVELLSKIDVANTSRYRTELK